MDMLIGVAYSEDLHRSDGGHLELLAAPAALRPRTGRLRGAGAASAEYLPTLRPRRARMAKPSPTRPSTRELLAWVVKRVTGQPLARSAGRRLLGAARHASRTAISRVDPIGVPIGGGGLCADLARPGPLRRDCCAATAAAARHRWCRRQVVADIRGGSDPAKFARPSFPRHLAGLVVPQHVVGQSQPAPGLHGRGVHGQSLYVDPKAEMVVARCGSHPVGTSVANDPIALPAFMALARALMGGER